MLDSSAVVLERFVFSHANRLSYILTYDEILRNELIGKSETKSYTQTNFYETTKQWEKRYSALCYTILYLGQIVGMISLSHINEEHTRARVGYWIASSYWHRGIATAAFENIIEIAHVHKIQFLSARIPKHSEASIRIWKKEGATFVEEEGMYIAELPIIH